MFMQGWSDAVYHLESDWLSKGYRNMRSTIRTSMPDNFDFGLDGPVDITGGDFFKVDRPKNADWAEPPGQNLH